MRRCDAPIQCFSSLYRVRSPKWGRNGDLIMSSNGNYVMGLRSFHFRASARPNDPATETAKTAKAETATAETAKTATASVQERLLGDYVLLQEDMRALKDELNECREANDSLRRELHEKTEILNLILEKERDAREQREFETEMAERAARGGLHLYVERQNALIEWLESHVASSEPPSSSDLLD